MNIEHLINELEEGKIIQIPHIKPNVILCPYDKDGHFKKDEIIITNNYYLAGISSLSREQFSGSLFIGKCLSCNKKHYGISLSLWSKCMPKDVDVDSSKVDHNLYPITLNEKTIGYVAANRNLLYNNDIFENYYIHLGEFGTECMDNDTDEISAEEQSILDYANKLVLLVVNQFINNAEFKKE